jgi:hypothetical protein
VIGITHVKELGNTAGVTSGETLPDFLDFDLKNSAAVKDFMQLFTKNTAFSEHNSGCIRSESCPMK